MPKRKKPAARRRRPSSRISARSLDQPKTRSRPACDPEPLPESDDSANDAAMDGFLSGLSMPVRDPNAPTLPVPDAPTLDQFLKEAGHVWRKAHWDTVMRMVRNARPIADWPGKSRCLDNGIIVEFRKCRFGWEHHEMWVLIPQYTKRKDIEKSLGEIMGWRKRLTEAQGRTITETRRLLYMLISLKKEEGVSYQNIANILNRDLEDLLRECYKDPDPHLARFKAQILLEDMGYEERDPEKIRQFIEEAVENIQRNRNPFEAIGVPISRVHIINVLKSEQPNRKKYSVKERRAVD